MGCRAGAWVRPISVSTPAALPPLDPSSCGADPPVHPATAPSHTPRCPQSPARPPPVRPDWLYSTDRPIPVRPCGTACRTANRIDSQAIPSLGSVTPSVASEHDLKVRGSSDPISGLLAMSCVDLELGPLSSTGMTRLHRSYEPVRHPRAARPLPRGNPVGRRRPPPKDSPHRTTLPIHACRRHDPGGLIGCIHRSLRQPYQPPPEFRPGRHPQSLFRDLLNVHDPLPPACSQNHPLGDPLLRRLRSLRSLHNRSNDYRLE